MTPMTSWRNHHVHSISFDLAKINVIQKSWNGQNNWQTKKQNVVPVLGLKLIARNFFYRNFGFDDGYFGMKLESFEKNNLILVSFQSKFYFFHYEALTLKLWSFLDDHRQISLKVPNVDFHFDVRFSIYVYW